MGTPAGVSMTERSFQRGSWVWWTVRRTGRGFGFLALSLAVTIGAWTLYLKVQHLDSYFAKSPADVWRYVFSGGGAAAHRHVLLTQLWTTLGHAAVGYVAGLAVVPPVAFLFALSRTVERSFMPLALVFRSVPLIAMTPLITLAFGRGLGAVTVVGAIATFFPTLVYVAQGLRSVPDDTLLLMAAYAAGPSRILWKVRIPSALPALFAAARVAAPAALLGAVLAEYLATGNGLGYLMLNASVTSDFALLWSAVVMVTVASLLVYATVGAIETAVLLRVGMLDERLS
jgi:ABC-type nitrate/sulfonate/bicarbonate transport system permease component